MNKTWKMKGKGICIGTWSFETWTFKCKNLLWSFKMGSYKAHGGCNIGMPHMRDKMLKRSC
jgi:hypothetical protein